MVRNQDLAVDEDSKELWSRGLHKENTCVTCTNIKPKVFLYGSERSRQVGCITLRWTTYTARSRALLAKITWKFEGPIEDHILSFDHSSVEARARLNIKALRIIVAQNRTWRRVSTLARNATM